MRGLMLLIGILAVGRLVMTPIAWAAPSFDAGYAGGALVMIIAAIALNTWRVRR